MAFNKVGTPQKITVLSGKCTICGVNKGDNIVNGALVCNSCMKKMHTEEEENEN